MLPKPLSQSTSAYILVIEDNVLIRMVLADALRHAGFSVAEATSADEALSYLGHDGAVDLVLSDIQMPGSLDGLDLARRLRKDYPALPIILTSGSLGSNSVEGIGLFIPKPYDVDHVAVSATLGHRPAGVPA
jgi:CheY-like chemotaxis protein